MSKRRPSRNVYTLPFPQHVDPTPQPAPAHYEHSHSLYAVDFAMPAGTPIFASLDGVVQEVKDDSTRGGPDRSLEDDYNGIIIRHPHGEYTVYVHLKQGALVEEGEEVRRGQHIGFAGLTGYTTYPHLHFEVCRVRETYLSIPARFRIGRRTATLRSPREQYL